MSKQFEQISIKPGFMKHNGGLLFRKISESEFEFKTTIKENHLNTIGITHGGYISSIIDSGAGTGAHRAANNSPCVTISLDIKLEHFACTCHLTKGVNECGQISLMLKLNLWLNWLYQKRVVIVHY